MSTIEVATHLQNHQIPRLCIDGLLDHHLENAMEVDDAMVLLAPATSQQDHNCPFAFCFKFGNSKASCYLLLQNYQQS
jgi:hypothetical protein